MDKLDQNVPSKPRYEAPTITAMSDQEVLKVFQVTSAGMSWWSAQ